MDNQTTIGRLFGEDSISFLVPSYQRAYSWRMGKDGDTVLPRKTTTPQMMTSWKSITSYSIRIKKSTKLSKKRNNGAKPK